MSTFKDNGQQKEVGHNPCLNKRGSQMWVAFDTNATSLPLHHSSIPLSIKKIMVGPQMQA